MGLGPANTTGHAEGAAAARVRVDCLVIGGGIAGLWTLRAALDAGYSAALVERRALGSGQTIASQGIIHGGIKYVLTGFASTIARAVSRMPEVWRECIEGRSRPSLTSVRVLSEHQYLWTTSGLSSRLAGLAASKLIDADVSRVDRADLPAALRGAPDGVDVYRVEEPILEPHSLIGAISRPVRDALVRGRVESIELGASGGGKENGAGGVRVRVEMLAEADDRGPGEAAPTETGAGRIEFEAGHVVLCAGAGNEELVSMVRTGAPKKKEGEGWMQRRPLRMVMVRRDPAAAAEVGELPEVFGHAIGTGSVPRVSVTTGRSRDGAAVWYIGGGVAERGAELDERATVELAREELADAIGWVRLDRTEWATLAVDRAEGWQRDAKRPDRPIVERLGDNDAETRVTVCWPTKLAFAPLAADLCIRHLVASAGERERGASGGAETRPNGVLGEVKRIVRPRVAALPWDEPEVTWRDERWGAPG